MPIEHAHRVGVVLEAFHELLDVLVEVRVERDVVHPLLELRARWQLAVDQQVSRLQERGALGELFDRVAAVLQDAALAVDVGDGAAAGRGVGEAGS